MKALQIVLLSLLLIFCGSSCTESPAQNNDLGIKSNIPPRVTWTSSVVEDEFIVKLSGWYSQREVKIQITKVLGSSVGWDIIARENPGAYLPTDFALIKVFNESKQIVETLLRSTLVRFVTPQRRIENPLLELPEEPDNATAEPAPPRPPRPCTGFCPKPMGRYPQATAFAFENEDDSRMLGGMRRLHNSMLQAPQLLFADYLWDKMYTGTGVKVAIFDTGLSKAHPHFRRVIERTNWTDEKTLDDGLGHGTFVTGVVAGQDPQCMGFAPDVDIHVYRVFTMKKVSYTSWFLDAFNYAIHKKINILNLSIGGPDFMDRPFVEKVLELSANNIIVVSAIGNDGPRYGTLNNPADQLDVIGVGGIDFDDKLAAFSSRGMTTWELPAGYGRVKPDVVAYGASLPGSRTYSGCRTLSGTSVASPVVAGAVALLASALPEATRWETINPASMKQILVASAERVTASNIFEQGFGKINLLGAYEMLRTYQPHASALPPMLDLTDCPYMWPFCTQPLYATAMPLIVNVTILNGMGVVGEMSSAEFIPGKNGEMLELAFTRSEVLWPWSGFLGVHIRAASRAAAWEGVAEGLIRVRVQSPAGKGERELRSTVIDIPVRTKVIPTPPRSKRLLWDQFHNLRYPSGYFPRDSLSVKNEPFDWNGDHPHTNFHPLYTHLREAGYYVEVLGEPWTCFDASLYGTLMLVDLEDEFGADEISKLEKDVLDRGLSLFVAADWYHKDVLLKIKFFDENTRQWWTPATGGANVPALNDLLRKFKIVLGDRIFEGEFDIGPDMPIQYASGSALAEFPAGGQLLFASLSDQSEELLEGAAGPPEEVAVLGLLSAEALQSAVGRSSSAAATAGRVAVYGDSNCLDDAHHRTFCFGLADRLLLFLATGQLDDVLKQKLAKQNTPFSSDVLFAPSRLQGSDLYKYSRTLNQTLQCESRSYQTYVLNKNYETLAINWSQPSFPPRKKQDESASTNRSSKGSSSTYGFKGYLLPYALGCVVVIAIIFITLRSRRDTSLRGNNKRIPV